MTNAEIIATIRNEIERLIEESDFDESANLYSLLSSLSTIESEKPAPADLEEAAKEYTDGKSWAKENYLTPYIRDAFIAGAKWQKEQDDKELSDLLTIAHLQGAEQMKEQMMENALHGWMDEDNEPPYDLNVICEEKIPFGKFKHGDKVRIIIVKED